jgi:hypothetical protein
MLNGNERQLLSCERLRELGYESQQHITLYGEDFYLFSNLVPDDRGFAVHGTAHKSGVLRQIRIPMSVVHRVRWGPLFRPNIAA